MNKEADQPEGDGAERSDFTVQSGRDIVCPCFEVTADDFVALFASDPDISFEDFLTKSGAGNKCTACRLDIEQIFISASRNAAVGGAALVPGVPTKMPLKQRLYRTLDAISPVVSENLTDIFPCVVGSGVDQYLCVANQSLLYEGEFNAPPTDVAVEIRSEDGTVVHRGTKRVEPGSALRLNIGEHLLDAARKSGGNGFLAGSVAVGRKMIRQGVKGTTRPQIELTGINGHCSVHAQGIKSSRTQWTDIVWRPADERIFLCLINREPTQINVPVELVARDSLKSPLAAEIVQIPGWGSRIHELTIPVSRVAEIGDGLVTVFWTPPGLHASFLLCGSPNLSRLSIDHV